MLAKRKSKERGAQRSEVRTLGEGETVRLMPPEEGVVHFQTHCRLIQYPFNNYRNQRGLDPQGL